MSTAAVGSPEWRAERRTYLGASESYGAINLLSPTRMPYFGKTQLSVYQSKVGDDYDTEETAAMRNGSYLEAAVAEIYADMRGVRVRMPLQPKRDREHPFLVATLDRTVVPPKGRERRLVEIKTSSRAYWKEHEEGWGPSGSGAAGVPACYLTQVQHQLMVSGYDVADVVVMLKPSDVRIYEIIPDPDFIGALREKEVKFWRDHVEQRNPPDPTKWDFVLAYQKDDGSTVVPDDDLTMEAAQHYIALCSRVRDLEKQKKHLAEGLKNYMGKHRFLASEEGRVLLDLLTVEPKTTTIDVEKIKRSNPELWHALERDYGKRRKAYRQLRIKTEAEEENDGEQ